MRKLIYFIISITLGQLQMVFIDLAIALNQDCETLIPTDVGVFITVSSLASIDSNNDIRQRQIELNWYNVEPQENDTIALYDTDPKNNITDFLESAFPINHSEGFYKTSIELPRKVFHVGNLTRMCIGYWVAYIRDDVILASNCLKIEPQWMWDSRNIIGNFSLSELMIPGTHNAGSFKFYLGRRSENIVVRYQVCQDEDLWNQLVFGIRHFDLRVGYYDDNQFWLVHDVVRMAPLKDAIEDVKKFINSTQEIVILDFHRLPIGFKSQVEHDLLINYITEELGEWLIPRVLGYDVTLNEMWEFNKRIMIFYSDGNYRRYENLWPGLTQVWANTMDSKVLKDYFQTFMSNARPSMWSAMAQLTPTFLTAISRPLGGVRVFADAINRNITQWFRDLWWDKANIIASDFFHGNNIVEVAVNSNKLRKQCEILLIEKARMSTSDEFVQ